MLVWYRPGSFSSSTALADDTSECPWSRTAFGSALWVEGQMSKWANGVLICGKSEFLARSSQPTDITLTSGTGTGEQRGY